MRRIAVCSNNLGWWSGERKPLSPAKSELTVVKENMQKGRRPH